LDLSSFGAVDMQKIPNCDKSITVKQ